MHVVLNQVLHQNGVQSGNVVLDSYNQGIVMGENWYITKKITDLAYSSVHYFDFHRDGFCDIQY
jgi:hypothetical protein